MNSQTSIRLHLLRTLAAMFVFLSHWSYILYKGDNSGLFKFFGHSGVIIFFVLSGYVIAYVSDVKHRSFLNYLSARIARIYSVVFFCLFFTLILDYLGAMISPEIYRTFSYNDALTRILMTIPLVQECGFWSIRYFSNGPMWSLSYEFCYYIIFGLVYFYKSKKKYFFLILIAFIVNLKILILFPVWLSGYIVYKIHNKSEFVPNRVLSALLILVFFMIFLYINQKEHLIIINKLHIPIINYDYYFYHSRNFISDYLSCFLISWIIYLFKYAYSPIKRKNTILFLNKSIKYMANSSFSLYAYHVPVLYFFSTLPFVNLKNIFTCIFLGILTMIICHLLSFISERKSSEFRGLLMKLTTNQVFFRGSK